jgi:acyl-CoA synthetase (AMP-forming)/AMP-acid ligase II/acyl carrier protein
MARRPRVTRPSVAHGDAPPAGSLPAGVTQALLQSVERFPYGRFVHVDADGEVAITSYAETLDRARRVLGGLRRNGFKAGDTTILYLANCADFVIASWAVLLGGGVIVPLVRRERNRHHAKTAAETLERLQVTLSSPWLVSDSDATSARGLGYAALVNEQAAEAAPVASLDDLRLLVLTSGTTKVPRLVALSERAILSRWWPNVPAADEAVISMSWSPFDHIMGLGVVSPNVSEKISLAPDRFAASPTAWLDAAEQFGVTHATMTNSGLAMIEAEVAAAPARSWDLSTLRRLGVGAEAISPRVCRRFMSAMAPFGLRPDAMILGYGLTECGPVAGGGDSFMPSEDDEFFVPLDRPTVGHAVRIVKDDDAVAPEGEIGAVQVRGPTMTSGYCGDAEATRALFTADGWIRTGDLGLLRDDRLTITGREKEQIAIYGTKYACAAIEAVAEGVAGVAAAYATACRDRRPGRSDGVHFAVFVTLIDGADPDQASAGVGQAIAADFGMAPAAVVPIEAGSVPRTPSGKVQRHELAAWLDAEGPDGSLADPVNIASATAAPESERERAVAAIWAEILGSRNFGVHDDFFTVGGDSLAAVRMVLAVEEAFQTRLPLTVLHEMTTIRALAAWLEGRPPDSAPHPAAEVEDRQRVLTRDWGGESVEPNGLVRGLNRAASQRPWFWCVQVGWEMHELARVVGDDHPLYAMRSGVLIMDYTPGNTTALASRYLREILAVDPTGPYLIGGGCQGGIVAREIARQLQASGRHVALLALIDTDFWDVFKGEPYPGRVACFAGALSRFNPLRSFRSPELGWRKVMPAGVQFTLLPADHYNIFTEPCASELAAKLRAAATSALADPAPAALTGTGALPDSAYRFVMVAPKSLSLPAGAACQVDIQITNAGPVGWRPDAGIALGNHWLRPNGEIAIWADGRALLSQELPPGLTGVGALPIRAPAVPGTYIVEFDMVEEGVTWFKDKGAWAAFTEVEVTA